MRTPRLPKVGPWTQEDEDHLQKVLATFPPWNSKQIILMRRIFTAGAEAAAAKQRPEGRPPS